jgi:hypothetical protein
MRLINVETYQVSEFFGDDIPPYAILSHRWGKDEVSFELISSSLAAAEQTQGFQKIRYCAAQTKHDGLDWCWVDTCCIDKRSSSELSEAINSMYQWYQHAVCCYAYLEDVTTFENPDFTQSKWFSRGWTLQELIAPNELTFYDTFWVTIGEKKNLTRNIFQRCGIREDILRGAAPVDSASIAQRMQWASSRNTSRVEDIAYCLMGIFDINMPLLYGEGRKAFTRLQEEIIKRSADQSIFAWIDPNASRTTLRGLFARSPHEFQNGNDIRFLSSVVVQPFAVTNRGLHITLPLRPVEEDRLEYFALLNCRSTTSNKFIPDSLAVRLRRTSNDSDQFVRVDPDTLYEIGSGNHEALYVPEKITTSLKALPRTAGWKLNAQSTKFAMSGLWYDRSCRQEQEFFRFNLAPGGQDYSMIRIMFDPEDDEVCENRKLLVVLVYNHRPHMMYLPEVFLGNRASNIEPYSCEAYIGTPKVYHDINEMPSNETVAWDVQELPYLLHVRMGQQVVGDEMVLVMTFLDVPATEQVT